MAHCLEMCWLIVCRCGGSLFGYVMAHCLEILWLITDEVMTHCLEIVWLLMVWIRDDSLLKDGMAHCLDI